MVAEQRRKYRELNADHQPYPHLPRILNNRQTYVKHHFGFREQKGWLYTQNLSWLVSQAFINGPAVIPYTHKFCNRYLRMLLQLLKHPLVLFFVTMNCQYQSNTKLQVVLRSTNCISVRRGHTKRTMMWKNHIYNFVKFSVLKEIYSDTVSVPQRGTVSIILFL